MRSMSTFQFKVNTSSTFSTMDTFETTLSSTAFLLNLLELKSKLKEPLPTDVIVFRCGKCHTNFPLNSCGSIIIENTLQEGINNNIDGILKSVKENHVKQTECDFTDIEIHPLLGIPENICITIPPSDPEYLSDLFLGGVCFKVCILIVNPDSKAIFALYQNERHREGNYSKFIKCNFNTMLNHDFDETAEFSKEDWIYDDESATTYQQMLPRLTGGGRTLREEFNYVCLWCPKDDIKKGKKGRFKELKNYRDHFKKYHHGDNGDGIPMNEFIKKINRCEPTWFCRNCKQHYSLGNRVRHKAICQLDSSDSDSDTDEEMQGRKIVKSSNRTQPKDSAFQVDDKNTNENTDQVEDIQSIAGPSAENVVRNLGGNLPGTNEKEAQSGSFNSNLIGILKNKKTVQDDGNKNKPKKVSFNATGKEIIVSNPQIDNDSDSVESISTDLRDDCPKRTVTDDDVSPVEEIGSNKQNKKQKTFLFEEVNDEFYISSSDEETLTDGNNEIKIDLIEEQDNQIQMPIVKGDFKRWWEKIPKHLYSHREMGGPKIFLPSDSDEFVKTATENYKAHMIEKSRLDEQMLLAESGDAKFQQFSTDRDLPFVEKYKKYVLSLTAKDVLNYFSDDYEELGLPQAAKSSTAIQYANRIMEFFKYLANVYKNFHYDWMLDFKNRIEKNLPNGDVSYELFLPTKQDTTDFIKQFKYGSNPAANCGVRIFALKKLMDFLSQEIKDNQHEFEGTLIDQSTKVECLLQKIRNLNLGICPEGTIKHLKTASNKSHKRTLVDQVLKCPERSLSSIMKGVSEYVESEEFNIEKTKLMELAYKKFKIPTAKEYMNSTNWLLEMLVCIGGNRPCSLLGITLRDWDERRPGYCPFNQNEENDLEEEDPPNDKRKVLKNPYSRPKGSSEEEPTGVIVKSETDKIIVGPPCYIWFPNALVDLVKAHALLTEKVLPRSTDIYHPKTRLFMNSNGKEIKSIDCKHLKNFIGLPTVAYDFRRSLSTFMLESTDDRVRKQESIVLRHKETTGYAYYYQKHSDTIEYVSIQYAMQNSLVKANEDSVDEYCEKLKKDASDMEWELSQKRTDKSLEYSQFIIEKRKQSLKDAKQKSGRQWILPSEYDNFMEGIEEAIRIEERKAKAGEAAGPFSQLLKYKPGTKEAGVFPPTGIWSVDMYRVLYGLKGKKGDDMRKAELSVYDGVPFSLSGRKKIEASMEKPGLSTKDTDTIVANYWREKIKSEARSRVKGKWLPLRFIFTEKDMEYHEEHMKKRIKDE